MVAAARIEDRSLEGGSLPPNELAKGTKQGAEYARYHAEKTGCYIRTTSGYVLYERVCHCCPGRVESSPVD